MSDNVWSRFYCHYLWGRGSDAIKWAEPRNLGEQPLYHVQTDTSSKISAGLRAWSNGLVRGPGASLRPHQQIGVLFKKLELSVTAPPPDCFVCLSLPRVCALRSL